MKLLLDTCTLLWLTAEPARLSGTCRKAIDQPDNDLVVSHASVWEMALKMAAGKLSLGLPLRRWLAQQREHWRFETLSLAEEHLLRTLEIERHHADPFDRLLIAQAMTENLAIATPDAAIALYPVEVVW